MINKKINIIYLIQAYKKPSGGSMVAYNHSRIINSFKKINISSEILYNTSIYVIKAAFSKNFIVPNLTEGAAFVIPMIISSFICSKSVH